MQQNQSGELAVEIPVPEFDEDLEGGGEVVEWEAVGPVAAVGPPEAAASAARPGKAEPQTQASSAEAKIPGYQGQAVKLVDLRGIAQPPPFSGDEKAWVDWRFRFQTVAALMNLYEVVRLAAAHPRQITQEELSEETMWKGRTLYRLLVALVSGRALGIIRQVPEGQGLEAWRCLAQEYEPEEPTRWCSMLRVLMKPARNEASPFMDQLIEWGRQVGVYGAGSGDRVTNPLKCTIVTGQALPQVRSFLWLSPVDYAGDYPTVVRQKVRRRRRPLGLRPDGRRCGLASKGIGKGKQSGSKSGKGDKGGRSDSWRDAPPLGHRGQPQGAGRGGGGGGQQWWSAGQRPQPGPRGVCFACGGPHRQQDCPKGRKGKGKSATPARSMNPDANLQCSRCKLWGHRRKNCRRVMAIEEEENAQVPALVGGVSRWEEELPLIAMLDPMEDIQELESAQRRGKPGTSVRRGLLESEAGMSVRQGLPEPDPSGIVAKTPQVSVTKPLGRAFVANDPGRDPDRHGP